MYGGMALALCVQSAGPRADTLEAGGYSFSDEMGGFRLKTVRGAGTPDRPFVIVEELKSHAPAILTVRKLPEKPVRSFSPSIAPSQGVQIKLEVVAINKTGRIWVGYDLELQEKLHIPSTHGDGLSFDQLRKKAADVSANKFASVDRFFEPHDRIHFFKGHVNPGDSLEFAVHITDVTPTAIFYFVQEPRFLFARKDGGTALAAASSKQTLTSTEKGGY
ncbi:MAG: hypothetical protein ACR2OR_12215 [Hyphomicrobiales bacterium]